MGIFQGSVVNVTTARNCFSVIPLDYATQQSTISIMANLSHVYSFTDIVQNSGPPYNLQVDFAQELEAFRDIAFDSHYSFQMNISAVMNSLYDAHTMYLAPTPFQYFVTFLPFYFACTLDSQNNQRVIGWEKKGR